MLPVRSKAKTTSPLGIVPGRNTVLCSPTDSPGFKVALSVAGVRLAETLAVNNANIQTIANATRYFFILSLLFTVSVKHVVVLNTYKCFMEDSSIGRCVDY
jgi:hypothetical protein